MAQKTSDSDDQPNPSSSSTKELPGPAASQKQSTSHTSSPAPAPRHHSKSSDPKDARENAVDSQSITKSAAPLGSNFLSKDAMAGPSPYGTRSRNRGQARPNYAEDVDVDMEDAYPEKKEDEPRKHARQTNGTMNGTGDAPRAANSTSRKSAAPDDFKIGNGQATTKETHATAASSSNAAGSAAPSGTSKKRKAPMQSTTNTTQGRAVSPTSAASNATGARRNAAQTAAAQPNAGYKETNMLSFDNCESKLVDGKLIADDGTILGRNGKAVEHDASHHVYLVCEPPGEPYYLGRIMEFLHLQNDTRRPVDALRINWYYRPKDIGKKVNDTRLVFATMHSDISPLTSLRGKCDIRHRAEIDDMDLFRKQSDSFWYEKLYDRYIQKNYDIIPCAQIVNVPARVKKVLDSRWRFILVEQGRGKEFTSAVKSCKRCNGYCASNDSVDCAVCQQTYHMNCVRPPLLKKPSRGFAWACAACSRAQERKLEARHTPSLLDAHPEGDEEEQWEDEEEGVATNRTTPADGIDDSHQPATAEQIYQASLWPYRYLGQHCKPEDALDYDDRIYPRAGSRLGPKHQATVLPWPGRPVELVKPLETKKGGRREGKMSKEALEKLEAEKLAREKRPKWVQDEPAGYVARGEDYDSDDPRCTAEKLWMPPEAAGASITDAELDDFLATAKAKIIPALGLPEESTNLLDVATNTLFKCDYNPDKAMKALLKMDRSAFKEPELSPSELKKFEDGVAKYGSELYQVSRHVKTVPHSQIVRFYYAWKKSPRGKQVWGNYSGRKGKKEAKKAEVSANKLQDDVADDQDDSAFDTEKALERKRGFVCKFCSTKSSRQWRRAPNAASTTVSEGGGRGANKDKGGQYIVALCRRCAELWRRYAIQWEDLEDLAKKVAAAGGRSWKRRVDEELLKELIAANEMMNMTVYPTHNGTTTATLPAAASATPAQTTSSTPVPQAASSEPPPRKKLRTITDREAEQANSDTNAATAVASKKKIVEKPPPPPAPELPKPRTLPCAICNQLAADAANPLISCKECRLSVHRACYGILDNRPPSKWTCDTCVNDRNPQVSIEYKCVLCPVEFTEHDFIGPPKNSHKKKTEREREKERQERELAQKAADHYRKRQEELNRPVNPREPLKRTADNNWVHVTCAVWHSEVKFANAKALGPSEGIPSISRTRYEEVCKACKQKGGACVSCHQCRAPVHVECAHKHGYLLGFEISPVKVSRRDQHNIVTLNGETGIMSAVVWCKEHIPGKTLVHRMHDPASQADTDGQDNVPNALQLFVRNFKQADLDLTGTVRKANLTNVATKTPVAPVPPANRRQSTTTAAPGEHNTDSSSNAPHKGDRVCITCGIDVSPKWWPIDEDSEKVLMNGYGSKLGSEAQKFMAQRHVQCHKCKKAGRKPIPHNQSPMAGPPPPGRLQAPLPPAVAAANMTAPPAHVSNVSNVSNAAVNRLADLGPWSSRPAGAPAPSSLVPAPAATSPLHPPSGGPPPPLPLATPHVGPSPMAAPGPPPSPVSSHPFPLSTGSYNGWQRTPAQAPATAHPMSSGSSSSGAAPVPHNHLRDLRPPPIAPISHHQPVPPIQHGLSQALSNGVPPSPTRRAPAAVHPGASPYMPPYHHQSTHHPLHTLTNGGPPPRASEHAFSQGLPPVSRDGVAMSRDPSFSGGTLPRPLNNDGRPPSAASNNPPPRPPNNDGRPPSGASASPSLRNLLS
ncbi:hypothetical protein F4780DRAFT_769847 [Xylariomycetidae sp. FL0641]|nr:hypothetical protein F4780DRAFT_769847 [Xylariomycetidae sp. FL0641]